MRLEKRAPSQPTSVLFMGRLAAIKGPDLLLDAFSLMAEQFPDVRLTMAGPDSSLLTQLKHRCTELGLDKRVTFPGFLGERERNAAFRDALLVVVPSRDEAMSLVALEAGAHAKPVLLTDRCGFDEVVHIGGGEVVCASVVALAESLRRLLSDHERLPVMGGRLREHVLAHHAWSRIAEGFIERIGVRTSGPMESIMDMKDGKIDPYQNVH